MILKVKPIVLQSSSGKMQNFFEHFLLTKVILQFFSA